MSNTSHTTNSANRSDHNNRNTPDKHSTTGTVNSRWSTQRIAIYALFVALAMVLSFVEIPIMPGVAYLKYDPSGIICLIAGFAYGPSAAVTVSVLSWIPHFFTNPFGAIMSVACALALSVPAALIYKNQPTRKNATIGMIIGAICAVVVAIVGNIIITPLYSGVTTQAVIAMIVPILLPFNALKLAIHCVVTFFIYKPVSLLVKRQH